jgi:hypothetical protein
MMKRQKHFSFEKDLFFAILAAFYGSSLVFQPISPTPISTGEALVLIVMIDCPSDAIY